MAAVRKAVASEIGEVPGLWEKMAGLGWMGTAIPEGFGGQGLGSLELAIILEETGRAMLPGPFFSQTGLAGTAIAAAGSARQKKALLPDIATGKTRAALALAEPEAGWDTDRVRMTASRKGKNFTLTGVKVLVPDAGAAEVIVVAACPGKGRPPALFPVRKGSKGLTVTPLLSMDPTRRLFEVRLNRVEVAGDEVVGRGNAGSMGRALDRATVALAAETLGVAQRAMEMSVEYAKTRVQFGRPIGSFQAVKHKCADMLVAVESARSAVYYAAWAVQEDERNAALAASMAKVAAGEAARLAVYHGIQVHGGIGFTWEHDMHFYFKRARLNETMLGDSSWHRERTALLLGW